MPVAAVDSCPVLLSLWCRPAVPCGRRGTTSWLTRFLLGVESRARDAASYLQMDTEVERHGDPHQHGEHGAGQAGIDASDGRRWGPFQVRDLFDPEKALEVAKARPDGDESAPRAPAVRRKPSPQPGRVGGLGRRSGQAAPAGSAGCSRRRGPGDAVPTPATRRPGRCEPPSVDHPSNENGRA